MKNQSPLSLLAAVVACVALLVAIFKPASAPSATEPVSQSVAAAAASAPVASLEATTFAFKSFDLGPEGPKHERLEYVNRVVDKEMGVVCYTRVATYRPTLACSPIGTPVPGAAAASASASDPAPARAP